MLCTTCAIIFANPCPTVSQNHQPTLQTLCKAASNFCAICAVLWNMLCRHERPPIPSPIATSLSLQPVSTYSAQRQSGSERSLSLVFTVNANGVGTSGVQGALGISARFLLNRVGGMYRSCGRRTHVSRGTKATVQMLNLYWHIHRPRLLTLQLSDLSHTIGYPAASQRTQHVVPLTHRALSSLRLPASFASGHQRMITSQWSLMGIPNLPPLQCHM
jgi:hypothetical protein